MFKKQTQITLIFISQAKIKECSKLPGASLGREVKMQRHVDLLIMTDTNFN